MSNHVQSCPMVSPNELQGHDLALHYVQKWCVMDEYQKAMDETLAAINKRYIIGTMAYVDDHPELSKCAREVEQHVIQVWTDRLSIQRFHEVLREYYSFWRKAIKAYKSRNQ